MTMPSVIYVDPDTPVGSVIFDDEFTSGEITQTCDNTQIWTYKGWLTLTAADSREDVLPGVYSTNVPGVGIRAAVSHGEHPTYNSDDLVRPWAFDGIIRSFSTTFQIRAIAQLVVTDKLQSGYLDTSRLVSQMTYNDIVVSELRFSPVSVLITTNTCNLIDKNISVPLKTVNVQDFNGQYSDILTDSDFKIEIDHCSAGTRIDYQFTSTGSTGVSNGNILHIASGDTAASGVGLQILNQDNQVITFDRDYNAVSSTGDKVPVVIPLKARYIKTGDLKPGKVDSVATFEVFYR